MLEKIGKWQDVPMIRVSVKIHRPSAFHEARCMLALARDKGLIITSVYAANHGEWQPFDFRVVGFPSDCHEVVKLRYPLLPPYSADTKFIQDVTAAIEQCVATKKNQSYIDLMAALADRASGLPPYVLARVDQVMKNCGFSQGLLELYEHRPGVRHLGSKAITDELFASVFLLDTNTLPGVLVAITYLHEGKPVIVDTFVSYASAALLYLPGEVGKGS
jgi:hypothetical protein